MDAGKQEAPETLDSVEASLRLCCALANFWAIRGYATEGRRYLERALVPGGNAAAPPRGSAQRCRPTDPGSG